VSSDRCIYSDAKGSRAVLADLSATSNALADGACGRHETGNPAGRLVRVVLALVFDIRQFINSCRTETVPAGGCADDQRGMSTVGSDADLMIFRARRADQLTPLDRPHRRTDRRPSVGRPGSRLASGDGVHVGVAAAVSGRRVI
jgi:hypothetical protein